MRKITVGRLFLVDGDGQALAALGATAREHLATIGGGHTLAETMRTQTGNFMGLISSFHDIPRKLNAPALNGDGVGRHPGRVQLYVTNQVALQADLFCARKHLFTPCENWTTRDRIL